MSLSSGGMENWKSHKYWGCGDEALPQARLDNFIERTGDKQFRLPTNSTLFDGIQAGLAAGTITPEDANRLISHACPSARIDFGSLRLE